MERQAAQERYKRLHDAAPWHDGSFKSWTKERSASHPYHHTYGTRIWVADEDLGQGGDFLNPSGALHGVDDVESREGKREEQDDS